MLDRDLSERFEARAARTASFAHSFVADLAESEASQAERLLGGEQVDQDAFEGVVAAFGFEAAVLLDGTGRVLHVWPTKPELVGTDIAPRYAHLRAAVAGRIGVSEVVPSAATGRPITAIAVPFETAVGTRIFSGAFSPAGTPLGAYLDSVVPVRGGAAYLLDQTGEVLASSSGDRAGAQITAASTGISELSAGPETLTAAVARVPNAPWRVALVAPSDGLYAPVASVETSPWILWGLMAAFGAMTIHLFARLSRARVDASAAALTDHLTGLPNRRALEGALRAAAALAVRHRLPLAALMIDVDNFKSVNDRLGHHGGDVVLQGIGATLLSTLRTGDLVARWGGEGFLVVLSHTDEAAAVMVAERIRCLIELDHSGGGGRSR